MANSPKITEASGEEMINANGILEPLAIRGTLSGSMVVASFIDHKIRGELQHGNEIFGKNSSDFISQFYNFRLTGSNFFEDRTPVSNIRELSGSSGIISNALIISGSKKAETAYKFLIGNRNAFDDTVPRFALEITGAMNNVSGSKDLEMWEMLLRMTGSRTDNYIPEKSFKSAGTGFTYDSALFGVDSVAFGGLKF